MASRTRWEYCTLFFDRYNKSLETRLLLSGEVSSQSVDKAASELYREIARLGQEGWELVHIDHEVGGYPNWTYHFKRPAD